MFLPRNVSYFFSRRSPGSLPSEFSNFIMDGSISTYGICAANNYRDMLLHDETVATVSTAGAGTHQRQQKRIADIARISGTTPRYGAVFAKLTHHYNLTSVLELGTSLGIGSMYFAKANSNVHVTTVEANPTMANFTQKMFDKLNMQRIKIVNSDFGDFLNNNMHRNQKFDIAFIDGNHKGNALLHYYNTLNINMLSQRNIVIIDDINWSNDMFRAWQKITNMDGNKLYINMFRLGIVMSGFDVGRGKYCATIKNKISK